MGVGHPAVRPDEERLESVGAVSLHVRGIGRLAADDPHCLLELGWRDLASGDAPLKDLPGNTDQGLTFAGMAIVILPPLLLFLVLQRGFIQGLTAGVVRR